MHTKPSALPWAILLTGLSVHIWNVYRFNAADRPFWNFIVVTTVTIGLLIGGIIIYKRSLKPDSTLAHRGPLAFAMVLWMLAALIVMLIFVVQALRPSLLEPLWSGVDNGLPVFVISAIAGLVVLFQRRPAKPKPKKGKGGPGSATVSGLMNGN